MKFRAKCHIVIEADDSIGWGSEYMVRMSNILPSIDQISNLARKAAQAVLDSEDGMNEIVRRAHADKT